MMPEQRTFEEATVEPTAATPWRARLPLVALVRLARPRQWVKNGLVFAALLFSGEMRSAASVMLAGLAFLAFCLASSAVYCLNDVLDAKEDRLHPKKRFRPVASGAVSPAQAVILALALGATAVLVGVTVDPWVVFLVLLYAGANLLYSFRLKHVVLLDVMTVASGFVVRAVAGAVAINVEMSLWFLVTVPLLSLFLAVSKRRHELVMVEGALNHRRVLADYSAKLLDQMLAALSAAIIMAYFLYAKETTRPHLFMLTSPLVVYGVFRYLYLVYQREEGGSPEEVLVADVPLLVAVVLWAVATTIIIYLA
jgi:4-hydroxybenzoate polyprenyltransferase